MGSDGGDNGSELWLWSLRGSSAAVAVAGGSAVVVGDATTGNHVNWVSGTEPVTTLIVR